MKHDLVPKVLLTIAAIMVAGTTGLVLHLYAQQLIATTPFEGMVLVIPLVGLSYLAMPGVAVLLIIALVEIWR